MQPDPATAGEPTRPVSEHRIPGLQSPTQSGLRGDPVEPDQAGPPEEVPAQDPLRQDRVAVAGGQVDGAGRGQFAGNLAPRIARADHQHRSGRQAGGVAVFRGVQLGDCRVEAACDGWDHRPVERAGRDHHLGRGVPPATGGDRVTTERSGHAGDLGAQPDRQVHLPGVPVEVVGDRLLARVVVGAGRERQPGQAVESAGGEQHQGVPALPPGVAHTVAGVQQDGLQAASFHLVGHGHARLAGADDDHIGFVGRHRSSCLIVSGERGHRAENVFQVSKS